MIFHCQIIVDSNFTHCIDINAKSKDKCLQRILQQMSKTATLDHPRSFNIEIDIISEEEQKRMRSQQEEKE